MQKAGKSLIFVGALLWVVTGAVYYSNMPSSGPRVAHTIGMQVATVDSAITDGQNNPPVDSTVSDSSGNAWEGPYFINEQKAPPTQPDVPIVPTKPWYVQMFGGFGLLVQNLLTKDTGPSYNTSLAIPVKSGAQFPPACTISIIPNSVPYGGSATVVWTSRNADHVVFQGIGEVARNGSMPVTSLTSTRALALAVIGADGSSSCYTVVNVDPVAEETPTCVISGHPSEIKKGESVDLSWGSQNAIDATLMNQGSVATVGGITLTPEKTTTYTLTVDSRTGTPGSCETTVTVL